MRNDEAADVALAARGDGQALERLYRRHVPRMHSLVRRMMGGEEVDHGRRGSQRSGRSRPSWRDARRLPLW